MWSGPLWSRVNRLGRLVRLPLTLVPRRAVIPILTGPLQGTAWVVGAGPHGYWLGTYESDKQQWLQRVLRPGDCFLDVGANVGYYSLLASRLVGRAGRVIAFEPLPRNLTFLKRHLRMNGARNTILWEAAVSDAEGTMRFAEGTNPSGGKLAENGRLQVRTVTLDSLWQRGLFPTPQVIKIDVEGAEAAVLRGAARLLAHARPVVLLAGHGWAQQHKCEEILAELNYRTVPQRDATTDGMYESIAMPLNVAEIECGGGHKVDHL
jgi:FkbM family methyltransferase